jgi:hypothetical protein
MVIETALMSFAPMDNITLLFAIFFINRILSGADEALAYDALMQEGDMDDWGLMVVAMG